MELHDKILVAIVSLVVALIQAGFAFWMRSFWQEVKLIQHDFAEFKTETEALRLDGFQRIAVLESARESSEQRNRDRFEEIQRRFDRQDQLLDRIYRKMDGGSPAAP